MDLNQINGIIRAVVPPILAYAVGKGLVPEGAVTDIMTALVAIAAAGWSVHSNAPSQVVLSAAANPAVEKIIAPTLADLPSVKVVAK